MAARLAAIAAIFTAAVAAGWLAKRWGRNPEGRDSPGGWRRVVWSVSAAHALVFSALGLAQHHAFRTFAYDLGIFTQTLWWYSQGALPHSTLKAELASPYASGFPILGDHFSPLLALLAPISWLPDPASGLIVVECVATAAAAPLLFAAAAARLGSAGPAAALAFAYLMHPFHAEAHLQGFHEVALLPLLLFRLYGAVLGRRLPRAVAAAVALLFLKEDMGLVLAGLGAAWLLSSRRREGIALVAAGVAAVLLVNLIVVPHFRGGAESLYGRAGGYYGWLLAPGAWSRVVADPASALASHVLVADKWVAQAAALTPFLLLPLLSGPFLILYAVPAGEVLFSDHFRQYTLGSHYGLPLVACGAVAAVEAWPRAISLLERFGSLRPVETIGRRFAVGLVAGALVANVTLAPELLNLKRTRQGGHERALHEAIGRVPADAAVLASDHLVPHLASRAKVYTPAGHRAFLKHDDGWVILDLQRGVDPGHRGGVEAVQAAIASGSLVRVESNEDFVLGRRRTMFQEEAIRTPPGGTRPLSSILPPKGGGSGRR